LESNKQIKPYLQSAYVCAIFKSLLSVKKFKAVYAMCYLTYATYSINLSHFDMAATIKPDTNTSC